MDKYLLWSTNRQSWWSPNSSGYTTDVLMAGMYPKEEALDICKTANVVGVIPNVLMIRTTDAYSAVRKSK